MEISSATRMVRTSKVKEAIEHSKPFMFISVKHHNVLKNGCEIIWTNKLGEIAWFRKLGCLSIVLSWHFISLSPSSFSQVEHEAENHLSRSFRVFSSQGGDLSWRFLVMIRLCKKGGEGEGRGAGYEWIVQGTGTLSPN